MKKILLPVILFIMIIVVACMSCAVCYAQSVDSGDGEVTGTEATPEDTTEVITTEAPATETEAQDATHVLTSFTDSIIDACIAIAWKLLTAFIIYAIGRLTMKWIMKLYTGGRRVQKMEPTARAFFGNFIKGVLWCVIIISMIAVMGVPMASVIAVLASAGAAVALALQGSLANFAGGIMILIFHPFRLDDFIEVGDNMGTVIDVGIYYTTIRTIDNKQVVLPNGGLTSTTVINYSKEKNRRLDLDINVEYGTDIEKAKEVIKAVYSSEEKVLTTPEPFIRITAMNDSAICLTLRVWCDSADYWNLKFNILEKINKQFMENNIKIPFNQMDIHIKNDKQDKE